MNPVATAYDDLPGPLLAELADAGLDPRSTYDLVAAALVEDVPSEDVTSAATITSEAPVVGDFNVREPGVVAGLAIAELTFRMVLGPQVQVGHRTPDGTIVTPGDAVLTVTGPARGLLTAERVALNIACHLSGIATHTQLWVTALAGTGARVLDTRKTLPGLRALQKYAVTCGGGLNHRFSLSDRAMVKDNHVIAAGGVVAAYERVRAAYPDLRVEVEVTDLDQLSALLDAGCEEILLDNMDTATMAEAVRITAGRATLEASGGLTLTSAREVAGTGVDFISVGALTHSVTVFDIGLDLREESAVSP
ncbi:carboxylating nicotinate-nucleotide diphosphorylase [Nocardioides panacisoli]|uniref:carboxylating nicotinate-nucleotide diphosphorylase n=1 Tax=Nocardioides panacisoli TaxID=627624 RepID=UPI001C629C29|nr:carboxylating nicotinate-nucleotide diphosphorylase [Nocardioides panacisoli]QYJ03743.1 carboxylating nicotinate-nucleotide diphosphorylase [Nocardioides panacisoli]